MTEFPVVEDQYFYPIRLNELVDYKSYQVQEFVKGVLNPVMVCNRVIWDITYPLYLGQPNDSHQLLAFRTGLRSYQFRKCIELDFWQRASETAAIGVGDCEDSSILTVAALRAFGLQPHEVWEVFGVVRDADGRVLGGHGWTYFFTDGQWHLSESTLDTPPSEYPKVANVKEPFRFNNLIYDPSWLWNDELMEVITSLEDKFVLGVKKENRKKYEAIEQAWKIPTKPLKAEKKSKIAKLRKALRL